jgi:hypothetical protein
VPLHPSIQGLGGNTGTRGEADLAMWVLDLTGQVDLASAETAYAAAKTCRTPNETWITKGNYRQHLHQKEITALPAPVQSLSANPFKTKQIHDEISRKSRKIDKYQQIGQSLGAPIFVQSVCAPEPPVSATPCSNAFAALDPPPTSESEAEAEYEYDTDHLLTYAQATHCGRRPTSGDQRL